MRLTDTDHGVALQAAAFGSGTLRRQSGHEFVLLTSKHTNIYVMVKPDEEVINPELKILNVLNSVLKLVYINGDQIYVYPLKLLLYGYSLDFLVL